MEPLAKDTVNKKSAYKLPRNEAIHEIDISKLPVLRKYKVAPSRSLFCQIFPELNNLFLSSIRHNKQLLDEVFVICRIINVEV